MAILEDALLRPRTSIVVIALNAEPTLAGVLSSVKALAEEIVVVDMRSDDRTVEIAQAFGAKVCTHERVPVVELARKHAVMQARGDWVLVLDADEEITLGLGVEIDKAISNDAYDVIELPRANCALSGFALHEAGFPEYHRRLFRRSVVDLDGYRGIIHSFFSFLPGARIGRIRGRFPDVMIYHPSNPTVSGFVDKINRYTTIEAAQHYDELRPLSRLCLAALWRPFKAFGVHYIRRRGFLDGWRGLWMSTLFAFYEWLTLCKIWEMSIHNGAVPTDDAARHKMRSLVAGDRQRASGQTQE